MESVREYVSVPCLQIWIGRFALNMATEVFDRLYHEWPFLLLQVGLTIQVHGRYRDSISQILLTHPYQDNISWYLLILVYLDYLSWLDVPPLLL